jgi:hypothetical protein
LALKIILAVVAVALGVWLGLPGKYEKDPEELERSLEWGSGRTRHVKRVFTPLAWVQRKLSARGDRSRPRRAFHLESPEKKDDDRRRD